MQVFRAKPGAYQQVRKKLLLRNALLLVVSMGIGGLIALLNSGGKADTTSIFVIGGVLIAFIVFTLFRSLGKQKVLLESLTLSIFNNLIRMEMKDMPAVSFYYNEITEITRYSNGNVIIRGKERYPAIGVSPLVENYPELINLLQQIHPITEKDKAPLLTRYPILVILLTGGLFFLVYTVQNKIVVAAAGAMLLGIMLWSLIRFRGSKVPSKQQRSLSFWIVFIMLVTLLTVILKLGGWYGD